MGEHSHKWSYQQQEHRFSHSGQAQVSHRPEQLFRPDLTFAGKTQKNIINLEKEVEYSEFRAQQSPWPGNADSHSTNLAPIEGESDKEAVKEVEGEVDRLG